MFPGVDRRRTLLRARWTQQVAPRRRCPSTEPEFPEDRNSDTAMVKVKLSLCLTN
jgi:hypothetical protein